MFKNSNNLPEASGIYMIINLINNHKYIGQSLNIKKRIISHHQYDYNNPNNCCYDTKFYRALRHYGLDNFAVVILELCDSNKLDEKEMYYIQKYNTFKEGYNSTPGGQQWSDNIHSPLIEEKRRNTLKHTQALQNENHPRAKLSNEEVRRIRQRYIDGEDPHIIYSDYCHLYKSFDTFKRIIFGYTYKTAGNIPLKENIRHTNGKLTDKQVRQIRELYANGLSQSKIAEQFNLSQTAISHIVQYKTYAHVK